MTFSLKSYYHAHELAYQQIKSKGYFGWGNAKTLAELGDEKTKRELKKAIVKYFPNVSGKQALDLGCGTGTTAFLMAKLGFEVTGVDISETAIEMANDLALKQDLKIQFKVADVLTLEALNEKFDFIYDSHCLHCIVFDEDRSKVLSGIKVSLNESGLFILDTMVMPNGPFDPTDGSDVLRFDDDFILWHKTKASSDHGIVEVAGQYWCAQRRIYPPQKIMNEINAVGFRVVTESLVPQEGKPSMLRLVLKK